MPAGSIIATSNLPVGNDPKPIPIILSDLDDLHNRLIQLFPSSTSSPYTTNKKEAPTKVTTVSDHCNNNECHDDCDNNDCNHIGNGNNDKNSCDNNAYIINDHNNNECNKAKCVTNKCNKAKQKTPNATLMTMPMMHVTMILQSPPYPSKNGMSSIPSLFDQKPTIQLMP